MRDRLAVAACIALLTALTFFVFPGHTYLQQDTQIYLPMLQQLVDPSLFTRELITSRPHLGWTIYDEVAVTLRRLTGSDFERILTIEQWVFRAFGIWGVYLIGTSLGFTRRIAMFITALFSLGAFILGPQVVTIEYEPTPRAFAVPLVLAAIGLTLHRGWTAASVIATLGLLYHAPTTAPFWLVFGFLLWRARLWKPALIPIGGAILLILLSRLQPGLIERQPFLATISPALEQLQRMRAAYNWVSLWPKDVLAHFALMILICALALRRISHRLRPEHHVVFWGLLTIGILSIPFSLLTLEWLRWSFIPQFQPARATLFITAIGVIAASAAGVEAVYRCRYGEAFVWMVVPFIIPVHKLVTPPYAVKDVFLIAGLAIAATAAIAIQVQAPRRAATALAMASLLSFFAIPYVGGVRNYPALWNAQILDVARWSRTSTARDAVFLFPRAGKNLYPGLFRVEAERAVYVDWKGGGQVNYFEDLALEWWNRWQTTMLNTAPDDDLIRRGINYLIVDWPNARPDLMPVYQNPGYLIYRLH